jgi:hypothetical protein
LRTKIFNAHDLKVFNPALICVCLCVYVCCCYYVLLENKFLCDVE